MNWKVTKPNYDTTFAPMLEIDGHKYYVRDALGNDAPAVVFEQLANVQTLVNKSECMRDMLITCEHHHKPKGADILLNVIKSAYRTILLFRPEVATANPRATEGGTAQ